MTRPTNSRTPSKLNPQWVKQTHRDFREFLRVTGFPEPERNGTRGSYFDYPEWLIMFIAILAVKAKVKSYLGIHRLAVEYWNLMTPDQTLKPISETQLRERLKKIGYTLGKSARFILQFYPAAQLAD